MPCGASSATNTLQWFVLSARFGYAVWVAIGGRGYLYGAIVGAAFVSIASSFFTGGKIPNIDFGIFVLNWVDWWVVILGLTFVIITLYAPKGIGGLLEKIFRNKKI